MNTIKTSNVITQPFGRHLPDNSRRSITMARGLIILLTILLSGVGAAAIHAQDPEPTPAATPAPAATPTPLPSPQATPLEGKVEGEETMKIEAKIQAYRSMSEVSRNIADDIYTFAPNAQTFVLYRAEDYKTWQNYRLNKPRLDDQIKTLRCGYRVWLSLAGTILAPVEPKADSTAERQILPEFQSTDECFGDSEIARSSPEVRRIAGIVSRHDDFLSKYPDLANRLERIEQENQILRESVARLQSPWRGGKKGGQKVALWNEPETSVGFNTNSSDNSDNGIPRIAGLAGSIISSVSPITAAVGAAIDLLGYFRSDLKFTGTTVNIKDNSTRASIANSLRLRYCGTGLGNGLDGELSGKDKLQRRAFVQEKMASAVTPASTASCPAIYDPHLFSPDGMLAIGASAEWMRELTEFREKSRVMIGGFDFMTARIKDFDAKIAALNTAIAADNTAIKDYTSLLITLLEKSKDNKSNLTGKATEEIETLIHEAKASRTEKIDLRNKLKNDRDAIKIPEHFDFVVDNLKVINASFDTFAGAFTKVNDATGLSPQMVYERAARLDALFNDQQKPAYWLDVNALEMEGGTRVRKNLLRYFYAPDIAHNGGSIVQYAVSDVSGKVLLSNTEDKLKEYRKSSNIVNPPAAKKDKK